MAALVQWANPRLRADPTAAADPFHADAWLGIVEEDQQSKCIWWKKADAENLVPTDV